MTVMRKMHNLVGGHKEPSDLHREAASGHLSQEFAQSKMMLRSLGQRASQSRLAWVEEDDESEMRGAVEVTG